MGFTHTWKYLRARLTVGIWEAIKLDTYILLSHLPEHSLSAGGHYSEAPLKLIGMNGSPPIVSNGRIIFNGDGSQPKEDADPYGRDCEDPLGCETFCLYRNWRATLRDYLKEDPTNEWNKGCLKEKRYSEFCKTNRKPYDLVVCAVLAIATQRAPGWLRITSSDGDASDWQPAVDWASEVLDRRIINPINHGIVIGEVDEAGAVQVGEGVLACSS